MALPSARRSIGEGFHGDDTRVVRDRHLPRPRRRGSTSSSMPTSTACPASSRSACRRPRSTKADFVFVSHAHFDHLYGADALALGAGATVVASPESAHCLRACGVPEDQLLVVTGGETVHCGPTDEGAGAARAPRVPVRPQRVRHVGPLLGDLDVSAQDRAARVEGLFGAHGRRAGRRRDRRWVAMNERCSRHDGGQLAYLLTTAGGSMLVSGSAGYWRGIFDGLRPDVALLSVGGRPNVDGEPFQGPAVRYMLEQVQLLRPGQVAFCHHDPLFPGLPGVDIGTRRRGAAGPDRARRVLRDGVRHAAPALRLTRSGRQVPRSQWRQRSLGPPHFVVVDLLHHAHLASRAKGPCPLLAERRHRHCGAMVGAEVTKRVCAPSPTRIPTAVPTRSRGSRSRRAGAASSM